MPICTYNQGVLSAETCAFYRRAIRLLRAADVPFLVGGAYALQRWTGIVRHTKDFDVFVRPDDAGRALDAFAAEGYHTERTFPHWLGKVFDRDDFVDVIYSSGNGIATVDDVWFEQAVPGEVLGEQVLVCPVEEMIWSKGFILERERYDGADIAHLLRARGRDLDWRRLLRRYDGYWRVLFSHLVLFGFIYPSERDAVPEWVMERLAGCLRKQLHTPPPTEKVCQGTILSREQYLVDVNDWGYEDARLRPAGPMTEEDVELWTEAIDTKK
ncbi:MAG TPA: hypothetical protein VJ739_05735 [Gemmataceae bacterium]|nr:hypothetical protein [Gemmataceae bacterium]